MVRAGQRQEGGTTGQGGRREIGGRIGWAVQVRQYTKGSSEITIFHSFARSNYFVQLKYRFSPPSPRLSRVRLCRSPRRPSPPRPAAPSFLPRYPPYGSIDRAQPRDSSPSRPRPFSVMPASRFLPVALLSVSPFLSLFPVLSVPVTSLSLLLSLCTTTYAIPAPIFNYWLRERSRTARKKRETKSLTVSACTQTVGCFTALARLPSDCETKRREIEIRGNEREKG